MFKSFIQEIGGIIAEFFRKEEAWIILVFLIIGGATLVSFPSVSTAFIEEKMLRFFELTWWFWAFFLLFFLFVDLWLYWRQELFKKSRTFSVLELFFPREVKKDPQAMEQVLLSLFGLSAPPMNLYAKYWDGETAIPMSLEVASVEGAVRFFVRVQEKHRDLVEAAFFSHYPDIEIVESDDYCSAIPVSYKEMQKEEKEMWGIELKLQKEAAYPIKTYPHFQDMTEEIKLDPISTLLEVLGKVKEEEFVGVQILLRAKDSKWKDEWKDLVKKLQEPAGAEKAKKDEKEKAPTPRKTPGEADVLEAVEQNLSKPAFDTIIRLLYVAPKTIFADGYVRGGLLGFFNQYNALHLNGFAQNLAAGTMVSPWYFPYVFPKRRVLYRKERLLFNYREREVGPEGGTGKLISSSLFNSNFASSMFTLNVEGVATIFHPPSGMIVTTPHMRRIESKRGGPPAGIAIFGSEGEIEKFY